MHFTQRISNHLAGHIRDYYCLAMWSYGSTVYGNKVASDHDIVIVIKHNPALGSFNAKFTVENYDIQVYCEKTFMELVNDHDVMALECLSIPLKSTHVYDVYFFDRLSRFELNLAKLRASFSKVSSNSYVKAKKKIIVEQDYNLESSIKSLWHSMRILQFGCQLASTGKISNFAGSNDLYPKIIQSYIDSGVNWEVIHEKWKPIYNDLSSDFKLLAPKDIVCHS